MKNTKSLKAVVFAALLLAMMVPAAYALTQKSDGTKNCADAVCSQPSSSPYVWGTVTPFGGVAARNITFFFDVSSYLGHQISNMRVSKFHDGWSASGNPMPITGILGFGSDYAFQPFGSIGGTNAATNTSSGLNYFSPPSSYIGNGTFVDFNSSYTVSDNIMAVSFSGYYTGLPSNWWCGGAFCTVGNNNTKVWGVLEFTDNGVLGNFTLPNITESYWPIDNQKNSTFSEGNAMTFLSETRGGVSGEGNFVVDKTAGLSRYTKHFDNGHLWIAFTFNSSISQFPDSTRIFIQMNETFMASDIMAPYKQTGVGGGWYDRYFRTHFFRNFKYVDYGIFNYQEVTTSASSGAQPFLCWMFTNRVPFSTTDLIDFKAVCAAPNGTANANDRVYLAFTNGTVIAQISNSSLTDRTGAVDLRLSDAYNYRMVYVTTARGNITEDFSYPFPLGTAYVTSSQGRTNNNGVQMNLITQNDQFPSASGGIAKITQLKASDYSTVVSETIPAEFGQYSFPLGANPSERTAYFISVQHVQPTLFSFVATDIQLGTVHIFLPSSEQATVSVSCDSPVQFLSNQARPVVCDTLYNPDVTVVGDILAPEYVVEPIDGDIYRFSKTTTGGISSVAVTDYYSGTSIAAQMSGSQLVLQNQKMVGAVGFSKQFAFTARFTDVFGTVSTSYLSFTGTIVDKLTDTNEVVNHRAIFLSYLDNATGVFNLEGAIVNISGQACTTQANFRNSTNLTVMLCSLMMPNSLSSVPTSYHILYNGTYNNISLNQTYWGFYDTDEWSDVGISEGTYGSVYLLSYNTFSGRAFEKFDIGTCNEPEVSRESVDQNDRCKPRGCPTSTVVSVVEGISVNPVTYTCAVEGQSTCTVDSISKRAYVSKCGTVCGLTTYLCPTAACNADSSGCSGEPTVQEKEDETGLAFIASNPLMSFIFGNMTFFLGLILVIAVTAYLAVNIGYGFAAVVGGFLLLGLIVIALPGGFLILLLVAAIVLIYLGYQMYAGITGFQMK